MKALICSCALVAATWCSPASATSIVYSFQDSTIPGFDAAHLGELAGVRVRLTAVASDPGPIDGEVSYRLADIGNKAFVSFSTPFDQPIEWDATPSLFERFELPNWDIEVLMDVVWGPTQQAPDASGYHGDVLYTYSAAPEPSSWLITLMGFGMIGGVMRSHYHRRSPGRRPNAGDATCC